MRNVVLPQVFSSQICNFGNNEVQMPIPDVAVENFRLESYVDGNFAFPNQCYQPNFQLTLCSWENGPQQPTLLNQNGSILEESEFWTAPKRNRSFDLFENRTIFNEWNKNKRRKATASYGCNHQVKRSNDVEKHKMQLHVPVRRSQKLSDKITALQQLVSPYGKTDIASVLEEASLCIKLLQQQIQKLVQMQNSSCLSHEIDDRLLDLQSRGLCLFPISITKKLSQECCFDT